MTASRRFAVLGSVAFLAYASTIAGGYAFDDRKAVVENPVVQGSVPLSEVWSRDWWGNVPPRIVPSFRPAATLMLAAEWRLAGGAPWLPHLVNVLLHVLATLLAFALFRGISGDRAAFWGVLLATLLACRSEAVDAVVGRADVLQAAAMLAAAVWHRRRGAASTALAIGAFALAIGAKETAIILPIWLVLADVLAPEGITREERFARLGGYVAVGLAYLSIRLNAIGGASFRLTETIYNPLVGLAWPDRWLGAGRIFVERYVAGILDPRRRIYDCSLAECTAVPRDDVVAWLGIALFLVFLASPVLALRRSKATALMLAWGVGFLAPVTNFLLVATLTYGERLLYVPLLGLCVAAAAWLLEIGDRLARPALAPAMLIGVMLMNLPWLQLRHLDWRSDAALAESGLRWSEKSVVVQGNNATAALVEKDYERAEQHARRAITLVPEDVYAHKTLALALAGRGDAVGAEREFRIAAAGALFPDIAADFAAWLARAGRYADALEVVRAQLLSTPDDAPLQEIQGRLQARIQRVP